MRSGTAERPSERRNCLRLKLESWRARDSPFSSFILFCQRRWDPCGPTTSGPAQLAVFDIAYPASKFSIRGGIVEVMCELESSLYGRGHYHQKIRSCQIAQTKRKWSSDELRNGSNNKEMIILKIK